MKLNINERRQAAEHLKNLMMYDKPSKWPKVLGGLILLGAVGGAAYWYYLPPEKRPTLDQVRARLNDIAKRASSTTIMGSSVSSSQTTSASAPAPAPGPAPASQTPSASDSSEVLLGPEHH